jgi:hypothetical protein
VRDERPELHEEPNTREPPWNAYAVVGVAAAPEAPKRERRRARSEASRCEPLSQWVQVGPRSERREASRRTVVVLPEPSAPERTTVTLMGTPSSACGSENAAQFQALKILAKGARVATLK